MAGEERHQFRRAEHLVFMNPCLSLLRRILCAVLLFFLVSQISGCSGSDEGLSADSEYLRLDLPALYSTVHTISIQVAHEPEAAPYTGSTFSDIPYWSILETNIQALFAGRILEPDVIVPRDLEAMEQIPDQFRSSWTAKDIYALANDLWNQPHSTSMAEFLVLFLKGYFEDQGTPNDNVLGVSLVGTPVIAVFKDVIRAAGSSPYLTSFVEQATLVHEFGHVMGLVNNGVPMVTEHEDAEYPLHCTNQNCVMYWQNEGAPDLRIFAQQMLISGSIVMFCDECLEDTRGYAP
ncbi:MAG TPA: hypothetical protein ENN34_00760 [Deltaproteobacteria bacterium]|nr:hypothetical protein [Deltaproteobacteria bacterium]